MLFSKVSNIYRLIISTTADLKGLANPSANSLVSYPVGLPFYDRQLPLRSLPVPVFQHERQQQPVPHQPVSLPSGDTTSTHPQHAS